MIAWKPTGGDVDRACAAYHPDWDGNPHRQDERGIQMCPALVAGASRMIAAKDRRIAELVGALEAVRVQFVLGSPLTEIVDAALEGATK